MTWAVSEGVSTAPSSDHLHPRSTELGETKVRWWNVQHYCYCTRVLLMRQRAHSTANTPSIPTLALTVHTLPPFNSQ